MGQGILDHVHNIYQNKFLTQTAAAYFIEGDVFH